MLQQSTYALYREAPLISNSLSARDGTARPQHAAARPQVLLVGANEACRTILKTTLEMKGYEVRQAAEDEALAIAERVCPDLIVVDTGWPGQDGLQTVCSLRQHRLLGSVPVIVITTNSAPDFHSQVLRAGGTECFVKPIALTELEHRVEWHLARDGKQSLA